MADQELCDALELLVEAYCGDGTRDGIEQIVGTTSGELSQQQKDDIAPLLAVAESKRAKILDENQSPSYDPTNAGSGYEPQTWTGGTDDLISSTCEAAQAAYDKYCNEDDDVASGEQLRHNRDASDKFKISGGI